MRGDGGAGIVDLVAARQLRQGQVEKTALILINKPAMLLIGLPVLIGDAEAALVAFRRAFDLGQRLVGLRRDDGRARPPLGCRPSRARSR